VYVRKSLRRHTEQCCVKDPAYLGRVTSGMCGSVKYLSIRHTHGGKMRIGCFEDMHKAGSLIVRGNCNTSVHSLLFCVSVWNPFFNSRTEKQSRCHFVFSGDPRHKVGRKETRI
jgi:hypothetical protein